MTLDDTLSNALTPPIWNCFKSNYYNQSSLDAVDLCAVIAQNNCSDKSIVTTAQKVTSHPEIQKILSDPITYDSTVLAENNALLLKHQFSILGTKQHICDGYVKITPFYNVSEHPLLPKWVIKAAGMRVPQNQLILGPNNDQNERAIFSSNESLLRLSMNKRIKAISAKLGIDVIVPREYAVPYTDQQSTELSRKYFIISEKLNILSKEETIACIKQKSEKEQRELAHKISRLITEIGYLDSSFDNIRFTREGKLTIIDTEPAGLMVDTSCIGQKGHSIEKCARIGLYTLHTLSEQVGLPIFAQEVKNFYTKSLSHFSITKIILSIICPLIPLVLLVLAVLKNRMVHKLSKEIVALKEDSVQSYPLKKQYLSLIEGIPFPYLSL